VSLKKKIFLLTKGATTKYIFKTFLIEDFPFVIAGVNNTGGAP
jgi:hypothetical protein